MRVFKYIAISAAALVLASCTAGMPINEDYPSDKSADAAPLPTVVVRGCCMDSGSNAPVSRMMIVLFPIVEHPLEYRDTTYTSSDGLFEIAREFTPEYMDFHLMAKDPDGQENGGEYQTAFIDINLNPDSPAFDARTGGYILDGNVFYLELK